MITTKIKYNVLLITIPDNTANIKELISGADFPAGTEYIIVDTNGSEPAKRFMVMMVGNHRAMWNTKQYYQPTAELLALANAKVANCYY